MVISVLALLFTAFSFWWMNWRKGELIVGPPRSYALTAPGEDDILIIQLPLVFYNNGAATQVVQNLRLRLEQDGRRSAILNFNYTVPDLISDGHLWAKQFAIEGRKAYASVFVFQKTPGKFVPLPGICNATLECKLYEVTGWTTLLVFDLRIVNVANLNSLLPYDNDIDQGS